METARLPTFTHLDECRVLERDSYTDDLDSLEKTRQRFGNVKSWRILFETMGQVTVKWEARSCSRCIEAEVKQSTTLITSKSNDV